MFMEAEKVIKILSVEELVSAMKNMDVNETMDISARPCEREVVKGEILSGNDADDWFGIMRLDASPFLCDAIFMVNSFMPRGKVSVIKFPDVTWKESIVRDTLTDMGLLLKNDLVAVECEITARPCFHLLHEKEW